jgi:small subunit ribosomal protein S20
VHSTCPRRKEDVAKKNLSALKRHRQSEKRRLRNQAYRSRAKTLIKKVFQASTVEEARTALVSAVKALDKLAAKGIEHRNTVARKKSRLMKAFNKFLQELTQAAA